MGTDFLNYGEILERLKEMKGFKGEGKAGDEELAECLGITPGSLKVSKSNNVVNFKRLIFVCREDEDIDMRYLFFGKKQ